MDIAINTIGGKLELLRLDGSRRPLARGAARQVLARRGRDCGPPGRPPAGTRGAGRLELPVIGGPSGALRTRRGDERKSSSSFAIPSGHERATEQCPGRPHRLLPRQTRERGALQDRPRTHGRSESAPRRDCAVPDRRVYTDRPTRALCRRVWDEAMLDAIRRDLPAPTTHARNLFHVSAAMWDAWAAYDPTGRRLLRHREGRGSDVEAAREAAISYAAYRVLLWRYAYGANVRVTFDELTRTMRSLCYRLDFTSTKGDSPAALGNRIAAAVIAYGRQDGSLERRRYADESYVARERAAGREAARDDHARRDVLAAARARPDRRPERPRRPRQGADASSAPSGDTYVALRCLLRGRECRSTRAPRRSGRRRTRPTSRRPSTSSARAPSSIPPTGRRSTSVSTRWATTRSGRTTATATRSNPVTGEALCARAGPPGRLLACPRRVLGRRAELRDPARTLERARKRGFRLARARVADRARLRQPPEVGREALLRAQRSSPRRRRLPRGA